MHLPFLLCVSVMLPVYSDALYLLLQVLASDCSQQDLVQQASGVIQAVLQGRNSVVLAMGPPASGKPNTLFAEDPNDPEADSSSQGNAHARQTCCTTLKPCMMAK